MPSETLAAFQFGDVVLVPFPFTNQTALKQRPAVVVSSARYNLERPDVVLMAITSQLHAALSPGDIPVEQWKVSGLLKPSAIKPVIATVEQTLIIRQLGSLQPLDLAALRSGLAKIIG
jgi:mRNA interferase MazF